MNNKKIIKFEKEGCAPCIALDAWLESKGLQSYTKINPFEDFESAIEYNIKTVPVLILIDENGQEVKRCIGDVSKNPKRYELLLEMYNNGD